MKDHELRFLTNLWLKENLNDENYQMEYFLSIPLVTARFFFFSFSSMLDFQTKKNVSEELQKKVAVNPSRKWFIN